MKKAIILWAAAALIVTASAARADYVPVDLSNYVNEGFTNSWFINGSDFTPLAGTTSTGNQGSPVPFNVAKVSDNNGDYNNFWFGLYSGPGSLVGPPGSFTVSVNTPNVTKVYTLSDNTFGTPGATEFSVTFNGIGPSIVGNYVGGDNTKDYNLNCSTTGCTNTPNAQYWFQNGNGQWLQVQEWDLPANFGLTSITFNQVDLGDGAIIAGVTLQTTPGPTPGAGLQGLALLALAAAMTRARALLQR